MAGEDDIAVIANRLGTVEKTTDKLVDAIESIDESLKTLTRLDVRHDETRSALTRAFAVSADNAARISAIDERLRLIESQLPSLNMVKGWVIAGVIGIVALVGMEVFNLVVNQNQLHMATRMDHAIQEQNHE